MLSLRNSSCLRFVQSESTTCSTVYPGLLASIKLEVRYIEEEINSELYNKFSEKYLLEKDELEGRILKASKKSSNLGNYIDISMEIASKMAEKWVLSDYVVKQKIQSLVFPDGITFSKKKEEV
jgi:site-specific DNA recombinase